VRFQFPIWRPSGSWRVVARVEMPSFGEDPANTSLRPEKENGHADTMLHSTGCGAENYVRY
jgi:hypothetical protein